MDHAGKAVIFPRRTLGSPTALHHLCLDVTKLRTYENIIATKQLCTDAPNILDTPSILGVSSIFRTPSTESIRVLASNTRSTWSMSSTDGPNTASTGYEQYICSGTSSSRSKTSTIIGSTPSIESIKPRNTSAFE